MKPAVLFSAEASSEWGTRLPPLARHLMTSSVDVSEFAPDLMNEYVWTLDPADWHWAPYLRKALRDLAPDHLRESWMQGRNPLADGAFDLLFLFAPPLPRCKELTPRVEFNVRCQSCGRGREDLPAEPHVKLQLPPPHRVPGLFAIERSSVRIISRTLLAALRDEGLARGLDVFPVEVTTPVEDDYFGIRVPVALDWAAAPFGCVKHGVPCDVCGSRYPRFAFYPTFERPAEPVDWMSTPLNGPTGLYVTSRVYKWLLGPGKHLTGKTSKGETVYGWRAGWFPDDLDKAFLPERFRGESDEPVEPLQPGEFPWFER